MKKFDNYYDNNKGKKDPKTTIFWMVLVRYKTEKKKHSDVEKKKHSKMKKEI